MYIIPYEINYVKKSTQNKTFNTSKHKEISSFNCQNVGVSTNPYRAYALTSPNFKAQFKCLDDIDLLLQDEPTVPRVSVQILKNSEINAKPGIRAIYEIALHDQIHDLLARNPNIQNKDSNIKNYKRKFDVECTEDNLIETLNLINNQFVKAEISERYFDQAKQLAPVGYKLKTLNVNTNYDYNDIPYNTSFDDYKKLIDVITYDDVKKYNNEILDNSDIKIALSLNRDFYFKHKEEISSLLSKIYG